MNNDLNEKFRGCFEYPQGDGIADASLIEKLTEELSSLDKDSFTVFKSPQRK